MCILDLSLGLSVINYELIIIFFILMIKKYIFLVNWDYGETLSW